MANHDNYDKDILKQLRRIANALEKISAKIPDPGIISTEEYDKIHPELVYNTQKITCTSKESGLSQPVDDD